MTINRIIMYGNKLKRKVYNKLGERQMKSKLLINQLNYEENFMILLNKKDMCMWRKYMSICDVYLFNSHKCPLS